MRQRLWLAVVVSLVASLPSAAEGPAIDHQPLGCVVAGRFPRLEARLAPAESIARARVQFQPQGVRYWYGVDMTASAGVFSAVLPRPKKSLASYRYYIEVTDTALGTTRTAEYTTTVAAGAGACADAKEAEGAASGVVKLHVPAGAPTVPGGFSANGVVAAGTGAAVAGVAVAAGATTAVAAGGGISAAALVIGGVAVAGAGAAVAVTQGRSGDAAASGGNERMFNGPFEGDFVQTLNFVGHTCTTTLRLAGTAMIRLNESSGSVNGHFVTNGSDTQTANTCQTGSGFSISAAWAAALTGTTGALEAHLQQTSTGGGPTATTTTQVYEFTGALRGDVIAGTMTVNASGDGRPPAGQGLPFDWTGTATIPVTLR
jgi:hypothetical protein